MSSKQSIAILGAGSWGTAVAIALAEQKHAVVLWTKNAAHYEDMQTKRCNERYLPQNPFPPSLTCSMQLDDCVAQATHVLTQIRFGMVDQRRRSQQLPNIE